MKKFRATVPLLLLLAFFIFSTSCSAGGGYTNISPEQAKEMLASGDKELLLLDVRTKDEYKEGHIKGAKLIPVQVLSGMIDEITDYREKKVIVYCRSGKRSLKASSLLQEKGFKTIYNMDGGIKKWSRLGYDIEK
jgi:rhodanese-related sulfurtransferase